jgi:hypothetical protein
MMDVVVVLRAKEFDDRERENAERRGQLSRVGNVPKVCERKYGTDETRQRKENTGSAPEFVLLFPSSKPIGCVEVASLSPRRESLHFSLAFSRKKFLTSRKGESGAMSKIVTLTNAASGKFLSVQAAPGTKVDAFAKDDGSGRQRWEICDSGDGDGSVVILSAEASRRWYLSTPKDEVGNYVDLYFEVDSERQKWFLEDAKSGESGKTLRLKGGRVPGFLSFREWDSGADLWGEVGPEGRQTWKVAEVALSPPGKILAIDPALKLLDWNASSKRTRLSYDSKNGAIRVDYPTKPWASAGGTNWTFRPTKFVGLPAKEARVSFDVFFPSNFDFEASGASAGKIGCGARGGNGGASGGNWSRDGFSFRLCWIGMKSYGSDAMAYAYTEVEDPNDFRSTIDQNSEIMKYAIMTNGGMNLFREGPGDALKFVKGTWTPCSVYLKLNTPGKRDGVIELSVGNGTRRVDGFRWLIAGSKSRIEEYVFTSWFGGSGSDPIWAPKWPCYSLTKNVKVWTS